MRLFSILMMIKINDKWISSFDYEIIVIKRDLIKMSILVNAEPVDALAMMIKTLHKK